MSAELTIAVLASLLLLALLGLIECWSRVAKLQDEVTKWRAAARYWEKQQP